MDASDWATLTSKIIDKWINLSEDDTNIIHPCQLVGLYKDGKEDPMFIQQHTFDLFDPNACITKKLALPLPVKCHTMGTTPITLVNKKNPLER